MHKQPLKPSNFGKLFNPKYCYHQNLNRAPDYLGALISPSLLIVLITADFDLFDYFLTVNHLAMLLRFGLGKPDALPKSAVVGIGGVECYVCGTFALQVVFQSRVCFCS